MRALDHYCRFHPVLVKVHLNPALSRGCLCTGNQCLLRHMLGGILQTQLVATLLATFWPE